MSVDCCAGIRCPLPANGGAQSRVVITTTWRSNGDNRGLEDFGYERGLGQGSPAVFGIGQARVEVANLRWATPVAECGVCADDLVHLRLPWYRPYAVRITDIADYLLGHHAGKYRKLTKH